MSFAITNRTFDYDGREIAPKIAGALETQARKLETEIEVVRRRCLQSAVDMGEALTIARNHLANKGDGTFREWAKVRCDIGDSTVTRLLQVYAEFGQMDRVELFTVNRTLDLSTIYLLASKQCPPEVKAETLEAAAAGEKVTRKAVREAIKQAKSLPPAVETTPDQAPAGDTAPTANGAASHTDDGPTAAAETAGTDATTDEDDTDGRDEEAAETEQQERTQEAGHDAPSQSNNVPTIKRALLDVWAVLKMPKALFLPLVRCVVEEIEEEYE